MKCTAILPCEKIIIDKEGAHSIINVMLNAELLAQKAEGTEPPEQMQIPANAVAPIVWWIYTLWYPETEDVGKTFDQIFQAYWPNGEKFMDSKLQFTMQNDAPIQTTFHVGGLPAGQVGRLRIATWIDHLGTRISEVNETYISIKHRPATATQVSGHLPIIAYTTEAP